MKWWGSFISAVAGISVALVFSVATQSHALTLTRDLKQGYSGADVSNLQQFLKDRGFYTYPEITTYYGPATKEAVAAFQRMKGIPPLGGVGPSTRAALNALSATTISSTSAQGTTATKADLIASLLAQVKVLQARLAALIAAKNGQTAPACSSLTFTRALDIGARGTDVSDLQTFLQARGYLSADSVTGYFGPLTSAAVKAFQKANRIDTVGTVGSITRATITSSRQCVPSFHPRAALLPPRRYCQKIKLCLRRPRHRYGPFLHPALAETAVAPTPTRKPLRRRLLRTRRPRVTAVLPMPHRMYGRSLPTASLWKMAHRPDTVQMSSCSSYTTTISIRKTMRVVGGNGPASPARCGRYSRAIPVTSLRPNGGPTRSSGCITFSNRVSAFRCLRTIFLHHNLSELLQKVRSPTGPIWSNLAALMIGAT